MFNEQVSTYFWSCSVLCCPKHLSFIPTSFSHPPSVGNKNDDPSKKQVDSQDAMRFGESVGVRVFETSAKENINVEEVTLVAMF